MAMKYTEDELNKCSKKVLISLFLAMQEQMEQLNRNMELLTEQVAIANQKRFGRSSEKLEIDGQLTMKECFNEAEVTKDTAGIIIEPEMEEVCPKPYRRKKQKGKREADLHDIETETITHELSEEQLNELFGENGWKRLPDEIYKRLQFTPASFKVEEHHVAVYAGKDNQTIIKADRPVDLLRNSIVTPTLEAAIMNSKYVNAIPLYRLEQEFARNDVHISRQVMANWTILCAERYLSLLYDYLHKELYKWPVIHADETPVLVNKDGRSAGSKSYMWVYRTGEMCNAPPIILYEYQKTRNTSHPREFLKDYKGTCVTDGYQVYHTLEKEREDLKIAGCWSHARRRFADVIKALGNDKAKDTLAWQALKQIGAIYRIEEKLATLTPKERMKRRQLSVKPLVEAFFAWIRENQNKVPPKSETGKGFTYCLNQEQYLKIFLEDGMVPADNNAAEQAIRGFCIGKVNWHMIDTINGAKASAVIYSIAETAKANNLKPYNYFEYLLTEIPKHQEETSLDFLAELLPWSESLPQECRKPKNK
ncbi:MAG TPA: IS66 family transposase [Mobilitalea sp.]|nr:IS66 family transposase [Mobilitalea sp.]